jgi:cytidine deaminase
VKEDPIISLLQRAAEATQRAYAPYSRFRVGAAVRTEDGEVFCGCNVENASFGMTVCAERVAVFCAVAAGHRKMTALAVAATSGNPPSPCGACRQVLAEFCRPDLPVYAASASEPRNYESTTLGELLPRAFSPDEFGSLSAQPNPEGDG